MDLILRYKLYTRERTERPNSFNGTARFPSSLRTCFTRKGKSTSHESMRFSSRWQSRAAFQKSTMPEFLSSSTKRGSAEALQGATGLTFPNTMLKTSRLRVRYSVFIRTHPLFQIRWSETVWTSGCHSNRPVCVHGFMVLLARLIWFHRSECETERDRKKAEEVLFFKVCLLAESCSCQR